MDDAGELDAPRESGVETRAKSSDWSLSGLMRHPEGMDAALAENIAAMERRTRDLIENGSAEDILAALDENDRQLEMVRDRIANLTRFTFA